MSHWIRRKNSQLNKRRPTARPTHSSGTGTESHTHTHTHKGMHIYTVRALHIERYVLTHNSYRLPCSHTPHTYQRFSLLQCLPFALNLSDAAFDKFALPSVVIFISSSGFFPPAAAFIMLARKSTVSPRVCRDKFLFLWCKYVALSHKWLTRRRTNTWVVGQRVPPAVISPPPPRRAESTFILQVIIYLLSPPLLFRPTDNINAAHLFNRIRR